MTVDKILLKIWGLHDKGLSSRKIEAKLLNEGIKKNYKAIQRILKKPRPKKPVPSGTKVVPVSENEVKELNEQLLKSDKIEDIETLKSELQVLRALVEGKSINIPSYEALRDYVNENTEKYDPSFVNHINKKWQNLVRRVLDVIRAMNGV